MRLASIALLIVTLAAVSCSGPELAEREPTNQSTATTIEDESPPESLPFAESDTTPSRLVLGLVKPDSFLPHEISIADQSAVIVSDLLYDGLVEAASTTETLRPALASEWSHDENFTTWTFTIDNAAGVRPSVIVDHFQRLVAAPPSGTTAFLLGSITSISVYDGNKVVFDLVTPNAGFAWMMSGLQFSIVGADGDPTGRYRIKSDIDDRTILDPMDSGPQVVIDWIDSGPEAYDMMTLGQFDAAVIAPENFADARRRFGSEFEESLISKFFVLNPRSELAATSERRESFHLAIDQTDMLDGRLPESIVSTSSILASSLAGATANDCALICRFERDQAATQFDDDVRDSSIRVGVILPDQYGVGEEIAEDLQDAGLSSEVVEVTNEELSAAIFDGDVEIFSFGWIAGATSIDAVIPAVLGPSSPVEPPVDDAQVIQRLLARAAVTESDSDRWSLLNDAYEEALALGLILPISTETHRLARTPATEDLVVRADGSIDLLG